MVYLADIRLESLLLAQLEEFGSAAAVGVKQDFITRWSCVCLNFNFYRRNPTSVPPPQHKLFQGSSTERDSGHRMAQSSHPKGFVGC